MVTVNRNIYTFTLQFYFKLLQRKGNIYLTFVKDVKILSFKNSHSNMVMHKKKLLFLLISNYTLFSHFLKWIKLNFSLSVENMTHKTINISSKVFFPPCFLQFFLVLFNWSFRIWCLSNTKKHFEKLWAKNVVHVGF